MLENISEPKREEAAREWRKLQSEDPTLGKMMLENISGPKREEAARDWRKLQSEDDQIKETSGACGRYGK